MKITKMNTEILNNTRHFSMLIFALILIVGCHKDDGPNEQPVSENTESIYGNWKVVSGNISFGQSKFVHFNKNNTMFILEEDDLGFKSDLISGINIDKDSITIVDAGQGSRSLGYILKGNKLTLTQEFSSNVRLERATEIPSTDEWIKTLSVLDKSDMPWGMVDIAFDGEHILRYSSSERKIQKIDPHSFAITGSFGGSVSVIALAIEKSDHALRQLFKAFEGEFPSAGFSSYIYRSNEYYFSSNGIGASITGLASESPGYIWAASSQEKELYFYKSNGSLRPGEVLETISLNFGPRGLDYRDGFLYTTKGPYIYKFSTGSEFQVVETFKIPGYYFDGITYDGTNFILNAYDQDDETYKLLRSNLSI